MRRLPATPVGPLTVNTHSTGPTALKTEQVSLANNLTFWKLRDLLFNHYLIDTCTRFYGYSLVIVHLNL